MVPRQKLETEIESAVARQDLEYLNILTENLESGISILDAEMNYLYLSKSAYHVLNICPDDLKPGDHLSKCHDLMLKNGLFTPEILEQEHLSAEDQIKKNTDGKGATSRLLRLGNGSTYRFVRKPLPCGRVLSIADDVSTLVEKEQLLDKALALGNAGYWSLDLATKKYTLGKSLKHYFGPEIVKQIHTKGMLSIVHPEDRERFKKAIGGVMRTGDRFEATCRTISYKGNIRWSTSSGEVVRDASGKAIRVQTFVKDVTRDRRQAAELEKAKDEAIAASKAKSEFLANMSHEIRTPMNGILGMAELLANSEVTESQREFISVINNSASALLNIINDILDFSKIEAGAFEIENYPFDFKSVIEDIAILLRPQTQKKRLELIINYPAHLPKAFIGDSERLRQVLTNLVGNAVKFTDEGQITIDIDIKQNRDITLCTVAVKDTGIGISPEKIDSIFEEFKQADGSTTRLYGGTGLGLTISKHIVEMMGGRMQVSSILGKGSSFGFCIPLTLDTKAKTELFETSKLSNNKALIIDDIQVNREIYERQLSSWGIQSESADGGAEALEKMKAAEKAGQPYDILLLDYMMPGQDGFQLAEEIKQTQDLKTPQIILLSSCDHALDRTSLSKVGIQASLIKPVRERLLYNTIMRTLAQASSPGELEGRPRPVQPQSNNSHDDLTKQDILVAEDFELNRDVVKLMLRDSPYQPVFAENGQEAIDMFIAEPARFPVILMDVSMPMVDGFTATRSIREFEVEKGYEPVPVIALTGHALKNDRQDCVDAGMNDYLTKPVKQSELLEALGKYINPPVSLKRSA